jgi:hypothetical protein
MSVPEDQIGHDHLQSRLENGLVSLRLPKIDVKAVIVADSSI